MMDLAKMLKDTLLGAQHKHLSKTTGPSRIR